VATKFIEEDVDVLMGTFNGMCRLELQERGKFYDYEALAGADRRHHNSHVVLRRSHDAVASHLAELRQALVHDHDEQVDRQAMAQAMETQPYAQVEVVAYSCLGSTDLMAA
jgi:hypothetical protein